MKSTNPDHLSLYRRYLKNLKKVGSGPEYVGMCLFPACRGSTKPGFYVNEETGQYHCKRCSASGNSITFARHFNGDPSLYYDIPHLPKPDIVFDEIEYWHGQLLDHPELWREPWTEVAVRRLMVGFDPRAQTLVFPIAGKNGKIVNVIHHKKYQTRGSRVTFYPYNLLGKYDPSYLLILEGLPDVVTGLSLNFQVISSTGGASAVPKDLSDLAHFSRAYLVPHSDHPGEDGAQKWIQGIRSQIPSLRLFLCDLSPFVDEKGDLTHYFSKKSKARGTFIHEVLNKARVATLYSDLPTFTRDRMLSQEFRDLKPEDQALFTQLAMRAARYRVRSIHYRNLEIKIPTGGFWTTYAKLLDYCPFLRGKDDSIKRVRNSIERLVESGFIQKRNLNWRRGLLLTVSGWPDQLKGHNKGHSNPFTKDLINFPPPPLKKIDSSIEESDV